jgi:peptidoglycan/xylan/chitin deacetylase (PgdA/CDA1 family)/ketosteroid isomerase-like protein
VARALVLAAALLLAGVLWAHGAGGTGRPLLVTVDDLPISSARLHPDTAERERITRDLLGALRKHGIKAVGLVTWRNVRDDAGRRLLELWLQAGHELGNHSHEHLNFTDTSPETYIADVENGRAALAEFLAARGRKPRFFRFPFLREGETEEKLDAMRRYLAESGQTNLTVTIDNQDYAFEEPWVLARRARDEAAMSEVAEDFQASLRIAVRHHEGRGDALFGRATPQILLLHATEVGAAQWDRLFTWLERTGHRFAPADEVLSDAAFAESHRFVGRYGVGLWDRIDHERAVERARREIERLLQGGAEAWSRGDLETFMASYADDAVFMSPSGESRGRSAVLDRYRKRYPDASTMGTLSLDILDFRPTWGMEVTPLGDAVPGRIQGASVLARWTLTTSGAPPASGLTLLVLEPRKDGWLIVRDASM